MERMNGPALEAGSSSPRTAATPFQGSGKPCPTGLQARATPAPSATSAGALNRQELRVRGRDEGQFAALPNRAEKNREHGKSQVNLFVR